MSTAALLESGYHELHGVDFEKGCYVGQDLTARTKYRGLVRKRLMAVEVDGPSPESRDASRFLVRLGQRPGSRGRRRSALPPMARGL